MEHGLTVERRILCLGCGFRFGDRCCSGDSRRSTRADSVQLTNGDLLNGEVMSLDARELKLKSEIHGQMTIARGKVAAVAFGEKNLLTELADAARAAAKQAANDRAGVKSERVGGGWVQEGSGNASAPGAGRPAALGRRTIR